MNLRWNVAPVNDTTNGDVGVALIGAADSVVVKDMGSAKWARQMAAALIQAADIVDPPKAEDGEKPPTESPAPAAIPPTSEDVRPA